jgi:hypothetical protein
VATTGTDSNLANNTDTQWSAVGSTTPTPAQLASSATLDRQTGLFKLAVSVTNTTPLAINGFRLHLDYSGYMSAYPSLRLTNATGLPGSGLAFIDYPFPLAVDGTVPFELVFSTTTRTFPVPFGLKMNVETLQSSAIALPKGAEVQASSCSCTNGAVSIEFPSVAGRWYRIRYSSDMVNWLDCETPVQASGGQLRWTDPRATTTSCFYLVNEIINP